MRRERVLAIVLVVIVTIGSAKEGNAVWYMQEEAPNDTTSRGLNEMKAQARELPPAVDPRDARIAALEKQVADLQSELARLRSASGNLTDATRRADDLGRQLADRDRELAALRSNADDSSKLASQLSSTQGELDFSKARTTELEQQLAAVTASSGAEIAALQAGAADTTKLSADLAATQAQLAALQTGAGDKEKITADLAAARQRTAELEAQCAAMGSAAREKDNLAAELAATKQRTAELEAQCVALGNAAGEKDKVAAELTAVKQRKADLEKQLADRDRELAGLRGDLSAEMAKLKEAQRGLVRALRPQIEKKNITVDLNNERLLINLASGYLFGSGEDRLKPAGAETLKQVGAILKDFPEYKFAVDGHTDDRPIRSSLKKKFPSNKELSEARAVNAAGALASGGLSGASTAGYADTRPVTTNATEAGRAQNRRVEVRVTKD